MSNKFNAHMRKIAEEAWLEHISKLDFSEDEHSYAEKMSFMTGYVKGITHCLVHKDELVRMAHEG